jgi:hypothetical protein
MLREWQRQWHVYLASPRIVMRASNILIKMKMAPSPTTAVGPYSLVHFVYFVKPDMRFVTHPTGVSQSGRERGMARHYCYTDAPLLLH